MSKAAQAAARDHTGHRAAQKKTPSGKTTHRGRKPTETPTGSEAPEQSATKFVALWIGIPMLILMAAVILRVCTGGDA